MKLSIRLNQQAVIIWYLTSKIRANRVARALHYTALPENLAAILYNSLEAEIYNKSVTRWTTLNVIIWNNSFPGCIREIPQKKLARERRHNRGGGKKSEESTNSGDDQTRLRFATKNSSCFAFPRETRRRNNHRKSRSRPRNDFSSACNGNIKA